MHREEEDSSVQANSSVVATTHQGGDAGVGGGGEEAKINRSNIDEVERPIGNRWPRQETLALLKIRSDMDQQFRGSSLKGSLWEEVSRKLAQLGYNRSAKKCREKFENVAKYHNRTKDGRNSKADGKTYRFSDQLAALENHPPHPPPPPPQKPQVVLMQRTNNRPGTVSDITVPSSTTNPRNLSQYIVTPTILTNPTLPSQNNTISSTSNFPNVSANPFSSSTSTSTASDGEFQGRRKRKRKWKNFFERLTKKVMKKQEELESKFLETIEKCEHDRMVREESWRMQEMSRINRKHEIFVQERSATAAKDAAVIALLNQMSGSQPPAFHQTLVNQEKPSPQPPPPPPPAPPQHHQLPPPPSANFYTLKRVENVKENSHIAVTSTSSRWPKPEVQALITLRTSLDIKYQENEPKGSSWEEISAGMRELGYNRSAKRCKEKWENINKYFKKVKESNKQRPEDSKTCPYFHQLDALYKDKINNSKNNNGLFSKKVEIITRFNQ
ncbi:trihelix transcription factor GT-2-like isoform X2 [Tripterygium wilfordii]|uniref:trihelix transcription factor GT-2-like isoform X2 n=1 Tax=Tripterygium wilfordii TaxID=458696 RepID=UPI0018F851E9|nr:trihelix transcription factor GT-2-like isoform X2 [Tripterygium wilfordii]